MANKNFSRVTNLVREKDLYKFYVDGSDTKFYGFDVKNRCYIGLKGSRITSNPFGSISYGDRFIWVLANYITYGYSYPVREYIDRIITNDFDFEKKIAICNNICEDGDDDFFKKNWKEVLDYYKKTDVKDITRNRVRYVFGQNKLNALCNKYNLPIDIVTKYFGGCTEYSTIEKMLNTKPIRETIKGTIKRANQVDEIYSTICNAIGIPADVLVNRYEISLTEPDCAKERLYNQLGKLKWRYQECLEYIKEMGLTDFEFSDDVFADHEKLKELAEITRNARYESIFSQRQTADLFFENEDYKTYIPTTYKELMEIGKFFHNCVAGHEWNSFLHEINEWNARNLVIVVDKKTDEWKICTDVTFKNKKIIQYLLPYNNNCKNKELLKFKEEYQNYLNTLKEKKAD